MQYFIELTARNTRVSVILDATPWPRKRAKQIAHEALQSLGRGIAAAIEAAPHIGTERALVDVSPIACSGDSTEPEKPTAPVVGAPTWESMEAKVKAVKLPEGVALLDKVRLVATERKALIWLVEHPEPTEGNPEGGTVELDFDLDADEVESKLMGATKAILEAVQLREEAETEGSDR